MSKSTIEEWPLFQDGSKAVVRWTRPDRQLRIYVIALPDGTYTLGWQRQESHWFKKTWGTATIAGGSHYDSLDTACREIPRSRPADLTWLRAAEPETYLGAGTSCCRTAETDQTCRRRTAEGEDGSDVRGKGSPATAVAPTLAATSPAVLPAMDFDEVLVSVSPNGPQMYQKDRDEAFRWYDGKGFPNPGHEEESNVRWFISMSNKADESSLWDEAWGGYHHAMAGAIALNLKDRIPDICWHLGRAHTALAHYDLATLYLETGFRLAKQQRNDDLSSRILLEVAVLGYLSEKPEIVQQAYERANAFLFPSGEHSSRAEKAAMTLFHEGDTNQKWRRNDKPVPYCLVHATGFYQVSLDLNRRINDKRAISVTLINMGHVWKMRGERDRAMTCWRESIPFLEELNDQQKITSVKKWMNEI